MSDVVDIDNLSVSFATDAGNVAAVTDVSLSVEAGEVLAIVLVVLGLTLVGESLNDLADPRLRTRRRGGDVPPDPVDVSVVPGGTLGAGPAGLAGLD